MAASRYPLSSILYPLVVGLTLAACGPDTPAEPPLFESVPPEVSGVTFENTVVEQEGFNVLEYEYFYNGAGVAVGDVDGDDLPDLYFTANLLDDALYLNRGDFRFEEVTAEAGIVADQGWTTGAAMADVDGDGDLDIYVLRSGRVSADRRRNLLYVNDGRGRFTEQAAAFGLDDPAYSNHATFFDYDNDGDLDLYLLNHAIRRYTNFVVEYMRAQRDSLAGDKLYRNDGGRFVDVSEEAGIIGNPLGFGLSAVAADVNRDGWLDLYVANDYIEDDYLYLNNGDGTFTESIRTMIDLTSYSSMGTDIADVNNDALPDIVTLDMLAEDNRRQKLLKGPEDFAYYRQMQRNGYHEQVMRNVLQVNTGAGTFSEVGQLAGVSNTDWSWAPLLADYDLDGDADLFVTNGYMRDYTNLDFLQFTLVEAYQEARARGETMTPMQLVAEMPVTLLPNYAYRNEGGLRFENVSRPWGLADSLLSNGAAYADLDADGDLDLVVSNINAPASLYRNRADSLADGRYLNIRLEGEGGNRYGIGTKVELTAPDGRRFYRELIPGRGYLSTVEPRLFFGVGTAEQVDLLVTWPDGRRQRLNDVATGQSITLRQADAAPGDASGEVAAASAPLFTALPGALGLDFVHREDAFYDFDVEPLLPHQVSREGPALARADVNRDGLEDVFLGGAAGQPGALYLQQADATFRQAPVEAFDAHAAVEDVDAAFFDSDGDGDLDLYVVSGGTHEARDLSVYQDRLYLNGGFGRFEHAPDALPEMPVSGGTVAAHDLDADGDLDLFVGGRAVPGRYPYAPRSYLLENTGGRFTDVTARASEALLTPGLVTDALWADLDADGTAELVLVGEWMPVRVFDPHSDGTFAERTAAAGLDRTGGWWHTVAAADFDGDGDLDLIAGNRGLNAQLRATPDEPARVHAGDLDADGRVDAVLSGYIQGRSYPVAARDELVGQAPRLDAVFPTYASYADATTEQFLERTGFTPEVTREAHTFASSLFENRGDGTFAVRPLPVEAQVSPVRAFVVTDVNADDRPDVVLAGNDFGVRPQLGRSAAGDGLVLLGRDGFDFDVLSAVRSGFGASGDVRGLALVQTARGSVIVVAHNDAAPAVYGVTPDGDVVAAR